MTRRLTWQLPALVALVAISAPAIASSGDELLAGCEALYLGDWQRAHEHFERAEAIDSTCPEAMVGIGVSLLQTGDTSRATNALQNALLAAPEMAAAHAGLAAVRYVEGDNYEAMLGYRRALGYAQSRRTRVRASEAYLACRLGLYQSAMGEAETAVRDDPGDELARHALGSSLLALGLRERAATVLARSDRGFRPPAPGLLSAPSALLSPDARYRAEHQLGDEQRLASILPALPSAADVAADAAPGTGLPAAEVDPHFFISYPPPGSVVSDTIEVAIEDDGTHPVRHIAVLLDSRFLVMSNAQPFRAQVNTTRVKDGLRELRVEGYATSGEVVAQATIMLQVSNGSRTLAPSEQAARELARGELLNLATLRAEPLVNAQLLGHAMMGSDHKWEAIAAWEYVFANDPLLPGARADLLTGYRELGLRTAASPREIHFLRSPRTVALTFDDGPHPEMTPFILDLLDRYHMKATFFLVGKQAAMYPELVREIARRGHDIGSHSHTHCDLRGLEQRGVEQELVKSRAAIRQACGQTVTLFRPPGGNYNGQVRAAAGACGYSTVFWTENIGNYPGREGPDIARSMIGKLAGGGIVLLHNGYDETQVALPHLLPLIASKGLRTGTITELTAGGG